LPGLLHLFFGFVCGVLDGIACVFHGISCAVRRIVHRVTHVIDHFIDALTGLFCRPFFLAADNKHGGEHYC
jgi:hypothetical protein